MRSRARSSSSVVPHGTPRKPSGSLKARVLEAMPPLTRTRIARTTAQRVRLSVTPSPIGRMCTSVEYGWRESSRAELLLVCSQESATVVEHGLLNDLVRSHQQRLRNGQTQRLRRFEVDRQLELGDLLYGEIGGFGAFKDLVDEADHALPYIAVVRAVRQQRPRLNRRVIAGHPRQPVLRSEGADQAIAAQGTVGLRGPPLRRRAGSPALRAIRSTSPPSMPCPV